MIKFKKRTSTNKIIVCSTNTGGSDLKLRDLRLLEKEKGSLEIKANIVITIGGSVEHARNIDEVSGIGSDSIVILLVGSPENISENQLLELNNLRKQLQEVYPFSVFEIENNELVKRVL